MTRRNNTSDASGTFLSSQTAARPDVVEAVENAFAQCPSPADPPDPHCFQNPWHSLWYDALRDQALPALISDGTITPAASLWTGARLWCDAFRASALKPGDRLVIAMAPSAAFVQVLVASIWEGCSIALVPPSEDVPRLLQALDARAAVADLQHPHVWRPEGFAGPRSTPDALRAADAPPAPDIRFLLRTSGTTGQARWVALSDRNVLSVLASHLPHFEMGNARLISVLPWWHAFGLVLDLMPALLSGAEIIRDANGGRDPGSILTLSRTWGATHINAVPLTIQRLLDHRGGLAFLKRLHGGIVGGAPISAPVAEQMQHTTLRVGYGQTEAAPGICMGDRGVWAANYLGMPVGCTVHLADDGELLFEGSNACAGFWADGMLHRKDPNRTVATGDRARRTDAGYFFEGRTDDTFKLPNGRLLEASIWETKLKSQFSALHDALLYAPDGSTLALALCVSDADAPPLDEVRSALNGLQQHLDRIDTVAPDDWVRSPKGDVAREAMADRLAQTAS
jgi:acyl-CoA synthetase (AMP-forming)/AMP-acid ligase II